MRLAGEARRGFLERAGAHTTLKLAEPWGDERPRTELVLIGEGFDEVAHPPPALGLPRQFGRSLTGHVQRLLR